MNTPTLGMRGILARGPVMPILTLPDASRAADLAHALVAGGVMVFEVLLRTPAALDALRAMKRAEPAASIGLGTVLCADDIDRAVSAGADFAVAPGFTLNLATAAQRAGLPLLPGVSSASEVMLARDLDLNALKLFPANVIGGVAWLKAMAPVFPMITFCPTGGIKPADIPDYLAQPNCSTVGGSWVVPNELLAAADWSAISARARQAAGMTAQAN